MLQDKNSKGFTPVAQIGILLALTGVGLVVASLLSAFIWIVATHLPLISMKGEMANPKILPCIYYHSGSEHPVHDVFTGRFILHDLLPKAIPLYRLPYPDFIASIYFGSCDTVIGVSPGRGFGRIE